MKYPHARVISAPYGGDTSSYVQRKDTPMSNSHDVFCLKIMATGTQTLEVHILAGDFNFQKFWLQTGSALGQADAAQNFDFALADFNNDGAMDLYCLKKTNTASGTLEVHVLNGWGVPKPFQSFLLQTGSALNAADAAANFVFAVADFNGDGVNDLYCIKKTNTGSKKLEVHVLNGADKFQTFLLHAATSLDAADAANFEFAVADFDNDGHPDLYCLKKTNTGTGTLEVHVLNGADNFKTFLLQTGTALQAADAAANFAFAVGDFNNDSHADVFCLKKTNTASSTLEVHILDGANRFQTFLLHSTSALQAVDAATHFQFAVASDPEAYPQIKSFKISPTDVNGFGHIIAGNSATISWEVDSFERKDTKVWLTASNASGLLWENSTLPLRGILTVQPPTQTLYTLYANTPSLGGFSTSAGGWVFVDPNPSGGGGTTAPPQGTWFYFKVESTDPNFPDCQTEAVFDPTNDPQHAQAMVQFEWGDQYSVTQISYDEYINTAQTCSGS